MWATLRAAILAKITSDCTKKQAVYDSEQSKFSGTPAIVVVPSEQTGDYLTNQEDELIFAFTLRAYVPIAQEGQHSADAILDEVIDELITIFTNKSVLVPACVAIEPINSSWGYVQNHPDGPMRVAELKLRKQETGSEANRGGVFLSRWDRISAGNSESGESGRSFKGLREN
jgi:hypothetical protein